MIQEQWLNSSGETLDTVLKENSDSDTCIKGNWFFLIACESLPFLTLPFLMFLICNNRVNKHDNIGLTLYWVFQLFQLGHFIVKVNT